LSPEHPELKEQNHGRRYANADGPALFRRLCLFVGLFFGGFFLSLRGWEELDRQRRFRRTELIGCALLLSGSGLLLWLLTLIGPRTWGWWL
jgi:hypothetical protein